MSIFAPLPRAGTDHPGEAAMPRSNLPGGHRFNPLNAWLFINRPKRHYAWLRRRYGEIVKVPTHQGPLVIVLTAEGARQVFTKDPNVYDAFQKEAFTGLTGLGSLWVLDGARHRYERQLLSPRFSAHQCCGYGQAIQEIVLRHTNRWQAGQLVNAYEEMLNISLDVILRVMFGRESGGLMDEGRRATKTLLHFAHPLIAFLPAFQAWWFPPWRRYRRAKQEFSLFVTRCLAECRRARDDNSVDVLGLMLSARHPDGTVLSDKDICDELITILLAGHETTAVALAWSLYELGRHPAVLVRLREELDALGPDPDPDVIAKQRYLGALCDETLRLHPILTEVARTIRRPCELLGYQLPAGTGVAVGIGAIHQDPSLYPAPDEFRPERFIERKYSVFEFLPFGGGHRRCLGAAFSDYEMRIALAMVVTRWDFEIAGKEKEVRHNIGTGPKHGVRMRVKARGNPAMPSPAVLHQDQR
jgi:cytochrome P450 family 110